MREIAVRKFFVVDGQMIHPSPGKELVLVERNAPMTLEELQSKGRPTLGGIKR